MFGLRIGKIAKLLFMRYANGIANILRLGRSLKMV